MLEEVHDFIEGLGVRSLPLGRAAVSATVITSEMWKEYPHLTPLANASTHGEAYYEEHEAYYPRTNQLVVVRSPGRGLPQTEDIQLSALIAHGLAHSAVLLKPLEKNHFYNEALAGIAEAAWLRHLENEGRFKPLNDTGFTRLGVRIFMPANRRYRHRDEQALPAMESAGIKSSTGLIASLAIELCLSDLYDSTDILRADEPRAAIKSLLDDQEKGLSDAIERLPPTVQGVVQGLALVQRARPVEDFNRSDHH